MTIDEELSIIRDNIAEYGQTNITQGEYNMIYNKAIDDLSNILKENYDYLPQIFLRKTFDGYIDEYAEQLKAGVKK